MSGRVIVGVALDDLLAQLDTEYERQQAMVDKAQALLLATAHAITLVREAITEQPTGPMLVAPKEQLANDWPVAGHTDETPSAVAS